MEGFASQDVLSTRKQTIERFYDLRTAFIEEVSHVRDRIRYYYGLDSFAQYYYERSGTAVREDKQRRLLGTEYTFDEYGDVSLILVDFRFINDMENETVLVGINKPDDRIAVVDFVHDAKNVSEEPTDPLRIARYLHSDALRHINFDLHCAIEASRAFYTLLHQS